MKFHTYVKSLVPSLETADLKENLVATNERIAEGILPSLGSMLAVFDHKYAWRDEVLKDISKRYLQSMRGNGFKLPHDASMLELVQHVMKNLLVTIPFIKGEIDKSFGKVIFNEGLTFSKANIMKYCETVEFTVHYTRVLLNYVTHAELQKLDGRNRSDNLPPKDIDYLRANLPIYVTACKIMGIPIAQLKSQINAIPDMVIEASSEDEAVLLIGSGKLDPVGFASLPFPISLIYHTRLRMANKQAEEYERIKAEEAVIKYRIILIQQKLDGGEGDAAAEKLLGIQEDRLYKTRRKLAELEEEYGV